MTDANERIRLHMAVTPRVKERLDALLLRTEAESITEALADLSLNGPPDLIISDYRLREGDNGIDGIRQLREAAGFSIPACLVSGNTDVALIQEAKQLGLTLLHKPVRPAKLRSLVRRLAHQAQVSGSGLT